MFPRTTAIASMSDTAELMCSDQEWYASKCAGIVYEADAVVREFQRIMDPNMLRPSDGKPVSEAERVLLLAEWLYRVQALGEAQTSLSMHATKLVAEERNNE